MIALGNTEITKAYLGSTEIDKMYLGEDLVFGGSSPTPVLPYDVQVEYLESDGSAFIDTNIIPTLAYSFECSFYYVSPYSSNDASATLFGCLEGWQNKTFIWVVSASSGKSYNSWGNKAITLNNATFHNSLLNGWHTLEFKPKNVYIDGVKKFSESNGTGNPISSMYIFCGHLPSGSNGCYGIGTTKRIQYAKIFNENNQLVRDYIPVRVNQVGYMYDKVSGSLFGNSGSGSFILGNDITT